MTHILCVPTTETTEWQPEHILYKLKHWASYRRSTSKALSIECSLLWRGDTSFCSSHSPFLFPLFLFLTDFT